MRRLLPFLALLLAALVAAASATASGRDVIRDCTDDEVMSKTYTQKEYRDALREFAAAGDADQYGNCRDIIRRAQQAALAASRGAGGTGGGATPSGGAGAIGSAPAAEQLDAASDAEREAVEQARTAPAPVVSLDRATVDPAKVGTVPGLSQVSDLPAPLTGLLALLLAGALAIGSLRIRRLVHARRT
ncbi:MAG: hypothetical protein Q8O56_16715 [Solirubrobacteraceae bacterium]|nr:hypothetical protein [Solirubrobacteraceae bacterium]